MSARLLYAGIYQCFCKFHLPVSVAQRMRIVLFLGECVGDRDIQEKLATPPSTISRWKQRYEKDGVLGLVTPCAAPTRSSLPLLLHQRQI